MVENTFSECLAFIFYDNEMTVFKIQVTPPVVGFNKNATPLPVVPLTKQIDVGPLLGISRPFGFAKNGELLLLLCHDNGTRQ